MSIRLRFPFIIGLVLAAGLAFGPALAEETGHIAVAPENVGLTRPVSLAINTSVILDLPEDVSEVIVSQPEVANAVLRTKRRAIVQAAGPGATNIFFMAADGRTLALLDVSVLNSVPDVAAALRAAYAEVIPEANIDVTAIATPGPDGNAITHVILSGTAPTPDDVQKATTIAAQFTGAPENVATLITPLGSQQVTLKVTVAEVNRQVARMLGIDLTASLSGGLVAKLVSELPKGGVANLANGSSLTLSGAGNSVTAALKALEQQRAVRTLAEPTLTALSGQPADFLAGGQFAVPTNIDGGQVSYSYKDFGLKLSFTPTIKSGGVIQLLVDTSMSELSAEGSVSVGSASLPGIKNRQAKTAVELRPGETLALGGLLQESTRAEINRMPGLGTIPVLGELFTSRDYIRAETELVVLVTPYLAQPSQLADALPVDEDGGATDSRSRFVARIETLYGLKPSSGGASYSGPIGYILD
jgi:pilus assembly protein CpaC